MSEPTIWHNMRAVQPAGTNLWHIEAMDNPDADPNDDESWGWVADVDGNEWLRDGFEGGETARLFAASAALLTALEGLIAAVYEANVSDFAYMVEPLARAHAAVMDATAVALARGEDQ